MKCKSCGQPKEFHNEGLWKKHQEMHKAAKEASKRLIQLLKKRGKY